MVVVGARGNWCPCGAGIFQDGSGDCFVSVDKGFFVLAPRCTGESFVNFYGLVGFGFCVFYMFRECDFRIKVEA